jgi:hypothetical protein
VLPVARVGLCFRALACMSMGRNLTVLEVSGGGKYGGGTTALGGSEDEDGLCVCDGMLLTSCCSGAASQGAADGCQAAQVDRPAAQAPPGAQGGGAAVRLPAWCGRHG